MEKDEQFIKDMESKFIPTIERMLLKEKEHYTYLKKCVSDGSKVAKHILKDSKNMIQHLEYRLQEYKEYVVKLKGIE